MLTHKIIRQYVDTSGNVIGGNEIVSADTEINFDGAVAADDAPHEIEWTVTVANMQSICIFATGALTLETNAAGGGHQEEFSLVTNQPIIWHRGADPTGAVPFSGDVTKLYATNPGPAIVTLKIRALSTQEV